MENFLNGFIYKVYELIYKERPSEFVRNFIGNLWHVAIGFLFYSIFGFAFQILAGRILGPVEYGKYAIIQSIVLFIYMPMNLGISTALIKYNAESDEKFRQVNMISTAFFLVMGLSVFSSLVFIIFVKEAALIFGVSVYYLYLSVAMAFLNNIYILISSIFRSLHRNKEYSFLQALYGFLIFVLLIFFILTKHLSFQAAFYASCTSYFIVFLIAVFMLKNYFRLFIDFDWLKKLLKYGYYATLGGVAFAFISNLNKILINKYLTTADVGIYNAYYFSSIVIMTLLFSVFVTVFFPTASKYERKDLVLKKINKLLPVLFAFGIPILYVVEFVFLKFYGKGYPIIYSLMLEFVITGMLIVGYGFYDWFFASQGQIGMRNSAFVIIFVAIINILISKLLISSMGLHGAIISVGISYFFGLSCFIILQKKIYKNG